MNDPEGSVSLSRSTAGSAQGDPDTKDDLGYFAASVRNRGPTKNGDGNSWGTTYSYKLRDQPIRSGLQPGDMKGTLMSGVQEH